MRYFNNKIFTNPGDPLHKIYQAKADDKGNIELVQTGVENTDDVIESYAASCDMAVIIKRIQNGEVDLLNARKGVYGDFTKVPSNFADVLQLQLDSNRLFDSMPSDIKAKFDNDANKFFAQAGTTDWYETISPVLSDDVKKMVFPQAEKPVESEVKTE